MSGGYPARPATLADVHASCRSTQPRLGGLAGNRVATNAVVHGVLLDLAG
jgi:hypothetical protein